MVISGSAAAAVKCSFYDANNILSRAEVETMDRPVPESWLNLERQGFLCDLALST